jgi:hypothetical protein
MKVDPPSRNGAIKNEMKKGYYAKLEQQTLIEIPLFPMRKP